MPRPSLANVKRRELIPVIARAFVDLGYRRATTAELAKRCKVQQNILYRLWPDKKAMFIASIEYVYDLSARTWEGVADTAQAGSTAARLLDYESTHLGEFGHSRIIFAGLGETDDPDIRKAMSDMYLRYQRFVLNQVNKHRAAAPDRPSAASRARRSNNLAADPGLAAWALVGLGTVASIVRELDLLSERERRRLMIDIGTQLLGSAAP